MKPNNPSTCLNATKRRGIRFLLLGILGGSLLTAVISIVLHDWSYLLNWISLPFVFGLIVARAAAEILFERLVFNQIHLLKTVYNALPLETDVLFTESACGPPSPVLLKPHLASSASPPAPWSPPDT